MTIRNALKTGRLRHAVIAGSTDALTFARACDKALEKALRNPCNDKQLRERECQPQ
jgi:hypothetical protein